jgi:hypothetical protein
MGGNELQIPPLIRDAARIIGGRFHVVDELGRGGTGVVHRCVDLELGRFAAVKVFSLFEGDGAELDEARRRFVDEARLLASSRHPQIVEILDSGLTPEGAPYIATELLSGPVLSGRGPMGWRDVVEIGSTTSDPTPLARDEAGSEPRDAEPIEAPASVSAEKRPTQDRARSRVPGRPLLIAGSVALALGVTLGAVALYSRHQALATYQEGLDLREQVPGAPDAETLARDADLETDYGRMGQVATGTAIGGGVALLAGAVMVAIGGRRLARRGSQTAWAPRSGGLAFHVRF